MRKTFLKCFLCAFIGIGATSVSAEDLPKMTDDTAKPTWYRIKNLREDETNRKGRGGISYAVAPVSGGQLALKLETELNNTDQDYEIGSLWYFTSDGDTDKEGYTPVHIYNALTGQAIANPANGTWGVDGDDITWYLKENTQGSYTGFNILHEKKLDDNTVAWNNSSNSALTVGYWNGNDIGSIWGFELAKEERVENTFNQTPTIIWKQGEKKITTRLSGYKLGEVVTCPAEIGSGSFTVGEKASFEITLNNNVKPFKLVSARHQNRWAIADDRGMATTADNGKYEYGSFYFEIPQTDNTSKLFCPDFFRYFRSNNGNLANTPIPYAEADHSNAGTFTIARDDSGAETIRTSDVGFNIQGANVSSQGATVSYWTGSDIGSLWFMVYDEDAYKANKPYYSEVGSLGSIPDSPFKQAYTAAKNKYAEIINVTGLGDDFDKDRNALQSAVAEADAARFGVAGVNIKQIIDKLNSAVKAVSEYNQYVIQFQQIAPNADAFAGFGIASAESIAAWNKIKEELDSKPKSEYTKDDLTEAENAYAAMVASAHSGYIKLAANQVPTDLLCVNVNANNTLGRFGSDVNPGKTIWKMKPTDSDDGFYLYNEYTALYLKFPSADNTNSTVVTSEKDASPFVFDIYDGKTGRYGLKYIGSDAQTGANAHIYLHSNGSTSCVRWEVGDNSSWYLLGANETEATNENFNGARDLCTFTGTFGDNLGEYTNDNDNQEAPQAYAKALADFKAVSTENNADKREAADALRAAYANIKPVFNMPQAGRYIRIKSLPGYYFCMPESGSNNGFVENEYDPSTIFYFTGTKLISYTEGCAAANANNFLRGRTTAKENQDIDSNGSAISFAAAPNSDVAQHRYFVMFKGNNNDDRTLFNSNNNGYNPADANAAGKVSPTTTYYEYYTFMIEYVKELPVVIHNNDNCGTIVSAMNVTVPVSDDIQWYTCHSSEDEITFNLEASGTVIPAGTPVIVYASDSSSSVSIPVTTEDVAVAVSDESSRFDGSYLTLPVPKVDDDKKLYIKSHKMTVEGTAERANFTYVGDEVETIPANMITVVLDADGEPEDVSFKLNDTNGTTTEITEISVENIHTDGAIYDLTGRKLAAPAKGVNIINGKKVML